MHRLDAHRWQRLALPAAIVATAAMVAIWPGGVLDRVDHAAYAVCHRLPGHSYWAGGRQLPLCARCSGTYLTVLAAILVMGVRRRLRVAGLPRRPFVLLFAGFAVLWAVDGLNSYVTLFVGAPLAYEPQNWLRLATGSLVGLAIATVLVPLVNMAFWAVPDQRSSVEEWRDLAYLLVAPLLVCLLVAAGLSWLLYPLALLSGASMVLVLGLINSLVVVALLRRDGCATRWRQWLAPLAVGVALAVAELSAAALLRETLAARFGLPF